MQPKFIRPPIEITHQLNHRRRQYVQLGVGALVSSAVVGCAIPGGKVPSNPSPGTQPSLPPLAAPKRPWALALGGGAARGFAHIGVLAALQEVNLKPDLVVGTSAGSVVGALYAAGLSIERIRILASELDEAKLSDWNLFSRGVIKGQSLQNMVNTWVGNKAIEQFPIRFVAVATDLYDGSPMMFGRGNAGQAVRASSSVPGLFEPVKIGDREYVDGGLVAPIPVKIARQLGAAFVLGVDISSQPRYQSTDNLAQIMLQTFAIMGKTMGESELVHADLALRPALGDLSSAAFEARQRAYQEGLRSMRDAMPKLRQGLSV